jgi:hypothetical protein
LTDPAFAQLVRDLGYNEIRYVDCGPWYTKAKYEQPLEHPDAGVEERMGAQWVLNEMAREEAEEAEEAESFDRWRRNDDCSNPVASLLYLVACLGSPHHRVGLKNGRHLSAEEVIAAGKDLRCSIPVCSDRDSTLRPVLYLPDTFQLACWEAGGDGSDDVLFPDLTVAMSPLPSWIKSTI